LGLLTKDIFLSSTFWTDSGKVKEADKEELIKMFSEEEVKHAVFDMKQDSAPSPNGFGATFFRNFGKLLKEDITICFWIFIREIWI
jgi:hypothetical protein